MTFSFGDNVAIGIAKEATRGTFAEPTLFIETTDPVAFSTEVETAEIKETKGTGMATQDEKVVASKVVGDIQAYLRYPSIGHFFKSLLGNYSVSAEASKYRHTFKVDPVNLQPTLSLALARAGLGHKAVNGAVVTKLSIEAGLDDAVKFAASLMGRQETAHADFVPAYTAAAPVLRQSVTVKVADTVAGLVDAEAVQSISIEIDRGTTVQKSIATIEAVDFRPGLCSISGEFVMEKQTDYYKDKTKAGTTGAVQYRIVTGTDELIITLPKVTFTAEEDIKSGEVISEKVSFKAHYDDTSAAGITVSLLNSVTTY